MKVRLGALALLVLSVAVHLLLTSAWRRESAELLRDKGRLDEQARAASSRLADLERRAALRAEASAVIARAGGAPREEAVQRVRRGVVRVLDEASIARVRLEVRPAGAPLLATVALSAEGELGGLVDLTARLLRSGSGLVLERYALVSTSDRLTVQIEAAAMGPVP